MKTNHRTRSSTLLPTLSCLALLAAAQGCTERMPPEIDLAVTQTDRGLSANICIDTNWHAHDNSQHLVCTANDVRVARATNVCVHEDPTDPTSACKLEPTCIEDTLFFFTADFEVVLTAQDRYDIGVYFATDGDGNGDGALSGQCVLNTIDNVNNTTNFVNNDPAPDVCGDIDDEPGNNPQIMQLTIQTTCTSDDDPENPQVVLPYCTSWRQPGSNELCDQATDAYPGSPSKCSCDDTFTIPVFVEPAAATVVKTAVEACVRFDVDVTNDATTVDLVLATLVDDTYGDITDSSNSNLCLTTCGQSGIGNPGALPTTLLGGETYSCEFWAKVASSPSVQTDKVTATFTGEDITPFDTADVLVDLSPSP